MHRKTIRRAAGGGGQCQAGEFTLIMPNGPCVDTDAIVRVDATTICGTDAAWRLRPAVDDNVQRLADVTLVFFGQALGHHS
jgi:threonine dehydrogenase-like Zn-dependent dehydrogenase